MALINCVECGNEISDKAKSCPKCGMPVNGQSEDEILVCPKCGSKDLHAEKDGFSGGKALAGALVAGGVGLLAGTIGSNDIHITCLKCSARLKPGEAAISKKRLGQAEIEARVVEIYKAGNGVADAVNFYIDETKSPMGQSATDVAEILKRNGIDAKGKPGPGCAVLLLMAGTTVLAAACQLIA